MPPTELPAHRFVRAHVAEAHGLVEPDAARVGERHPRPRPAVALKPDFAEAWLGRGNAHCDLKHHDEALAAFDRALALLPNLAAAWLGRGNVFHDRKSFVDALTAYDQALALDPGIVGAWIGRGDSLRFLKRMPESIAAYRQALKLGGDPESIKFYLAALGAEPLPAK